jgi:hypothetical protein
MCAVIGAFERSTVTVGGLYHNENKRLLIDAIGFIVLIAHDETVLRTYFEVPQRHSAGTDGPEITLRDVSLP